MKTHFLVKACFILLALSLQACSQKNSPASIFEEARFREHLKTLASDDFGGRAPASPGEELTVNYLVENFKKYGLQPGNGESFTQDVPLISSEITNTPGLHITGLDGELSLHYETDYMASTRREQTQITLENSELVFVGYGINAPERNWNDYAGVDVKGKTVVMLVNDPGYATQNPQLFNGNAMTYYGRWDYKFDEAARQGAAAALIIHDTKPAAYPWSTVVNSWSGKQFDIVRANKGEDLCSLEGWITLDTAKALFAKAGLVFEKQILAAQSPGFRAVNMNLRATTAIENSLEKVVSKNVVALLPGTEKPEEVFVFTAHWDHFGTKPELEGDTIFNGAMDNASGTAAILELAAAFSADKSKNRRSVLFLATTAEEQGLLGSQYYAEHPLYPLEKTVAGLNMDGMNIIGPTKDIVVRGYNFSELDGFLKQAADAQERVLVPDPTPQNGYYFRSDHFELAKKGVPMIYAKSGYDHIKLGYEYGKTKAEEYIAEHYHQVSDEYRDDWDLSGAMQDIALYYETARLITDSDVWPNWHEGSEFKAIRDAQLKTSSELTSP